MLDLALLRLLKERGSYFQLQGRLPKAALDPQTTALVDDFGAYFERFPDAEKIDMQEFLTVFRSRHPGMKPESLSAYEKIIASLRTDLPAEKKPGILNQLLELRMAHAMALALEEWNEGELANIHAKFRGLIDEFERDADVETLDYLRIDLDALLDKSDEENGLRWRLECLRDSMRGLLPGDFGIIAGRPDKGKTTFIASETTYMAPQLAKDRPILWLNNEGPGSRIYLRTIQAALGLTPGDLRAMKAEGKDVTSIYAKAVGGDAYKIRIVDIHGLDTYAVENLIRANTPGVVIYDMIDKINGFGDAARTDLGLERMYDWARELCVKYELVGLATSQISVEGDGLRFPTLSMLKDSKTGKQGACDFQLMIGASNEPALNGQRYIGLPKNKLRREGRPQDPQATVKFSPGIARFEDIPIDGVPEGEENA